MLAPKECEVLRLVAKGYSNEHIAVLLQVHKTTVEIYLGRVYDSVIIPPEASKRVCIATHAEEIIAENHMVGDKKYRRTT